MFSAVAKQFVERVIKSYKSTLVGLLCGAGVILFDVLVTSLDGNPSTWAKVASGLCLVVGASLRKKALEPAPLQAVPPQG